MNTPSPDFGSGEVYILPRPRCPTHGYLTHHSTAWTCPGYDGEGCPHTVTDAEHFTTARHLGTLEPTEKTSPPAATIHQ